MRKRVLDLFNRKKDQSSKNSKTNKSNDQLMSSKSSNIGCISFGCCNLHNPSCCEIHKKDSESISNNNDRIHQLEYENKALDSMKITLFKNDDIISNNHATNLIEDDELVLSCIIMQSPQSIDADESLRIDSSPISVPVEILSSKLLPLQPYGCVDIFESNSEAILSPSKKRVQAIGIDLYNNENSLSNIAKQLPNKITYINEPTNYHFMDTTIQHVYRTILDKTLSQISIGTLISYYRLNEIKQSLHALNIIPFLKIIFLIMILILTSMMFPHSKVLRYDHSSIYKYISLPVNKSFNGSITYQHDSVNNHNNYTSTNHVLVVVDLDKDLNKTNSNKKQTYESHSFLLLKHIQHHIIMQLNPTNPRKKGYHSSQKQHLPQYLSTYVLAYNHNNNKYNILTIIKEILRTQFKKYNLKQNFNKILIKLKSYPSNQKVKIKKILNNIKRNIISIDFIKLAKFLLYANKKIDEAYLKAWQSI